MSEVAKVREALERLKPPPIQPGTLHHDVIAAFVAHGLKVCEEYDHDHVGCISRGCAVCSSLDDRIDLFAAILRDAGLMEEGR